MSLKAFHIVFVIVSIAFTGGFGLWAINDHRSSGSLMFLGMGILSIVLGALLVWYSSWFLKKLKNVSFL